MSLGQASTVYLQVEAVLLNATYRQTSFSHKVLTDLFIFVLCNDENYCSTFYHSENIGSYASCQLDMVTTFSCFRGWVHLNEGQKGVPFTFFCPQIPLYN